MISYFIYLDSLAYQVADLLSEPIQKHDIESVVKAKKLFSSCINEGNYEEQANEDYRIYYFLIKYRNHQV